MRVARNIGEFSDFRDELTHGDPRPTVALVATMGALHAGHRSLIRIARNVADVVVVSIFVNPLQFGPDADYARYPRVLDEDLEVCQSEGVNIAFVPSVAELYPAGRQVTLCAGQLGTRSASPTTSPAITAATVATTVVSNSGPAVRRRSEPAWRSTRMKPA